MVNGIRKGEFRDDPSHLRDYGARVGRKRKQLVSTSRQCHCCGKEPVMPGNWWLGEKCYTKNYELKRDSVLMEVIA